MIVKIMRFMFVPLASRTGAAVPAVADCDCCALLWFDMAAHNKGKAFLNPELWTDASARHAAMAKPLDFKSIAGFQSPPRAGLICGFDDLLQFVRKQKCQRDYLIANTMLVDFKMPPVPMSRWPPSACSTEPSFGPMAIVQQRAGQFQRRASRGTRARQFLFS